MFIEQAPCNCIFQLLDKFPTFIGIKYCYILSQSDECGNDEPIQLIGILNSNKLFVSDLAFKKFSTFSIKIDSCIEQPIVALVYSWRLAATVILVRDQFSVKP